MGSWVSHHPVLRTLSSEPYLLTLLKKKSGSRHAMGTTMMYSQYCGFQATIPRKSQYKSSEMLSEMELKARRNNHHTTVQCTSSRRVHRVSDEVIRTCTTI
jgi:hypothetical protein